MHIKYFHHIYSHYSSSQHFNDICKSKKEKKNRKLILKIIELKVFQILMSQFPLVLRSIIILLIRQRNFTGQLIKPCMRLKKAAETEWLSLKYKRSVFFKDKIMVEVWAAAVKIMCCYLESCIKQGIWEFIRTGKSVFAAAVIFSDNYN